MIKIAQYENMFSLYLTIVVIIPSIFLCFWKRKSKILNLVISILTIMLTLGIPSIQLLEFIGFIFVESLLVYFYAKFRKKCSSELLYFCIFALSIFPLFFVRISAFKTEIASFVGFTGISYMCFKIWQILFEIHDGKIEQLSIIDFFGFILFFPSFSSGPIARYQEFNINYIENTTDYFTEYFVLGVKKILLGLFYKFAVAYFISTYFMVKVPDEITLINIVLYMYAYTLYLFFDFAGYSNIAIGIAALVGIRLPENFNKPFLACNMKEFWNRWHMSLSNWFNDYVFGRFVLNNIRNGLFKSSKTATRVAYLFTMTIMGLWHGFSIHYIIYGIYEGVLLVLTDVWIKSKTYRKFKKQKYYTLISRIICFQFIAFGMLLFSGHYFFE